MTSADDRNAAVFVRNRTLTADLAKRTAVAICRRGGILSIVAPSGTVTFLFTDIEGSTAAWDRHPTEMDKASWRHDVILREAVGTRGGYVFSTGGDGLAAAFSSAADALDAAVTAQREFAAEPWPHPVSIKVRMGLHTGDAVERDGDYFGPHVIRAARLMSLVGGGRIVCSAATMRSVGAHTPPDVGLVPVGSVSLKGLADTEAVFAAAGRGLAETGAAVGLVLASVDRVPTYAGALVGREDALATVVAAVAASPLTTITGTAGVGKTRLAAEVCGAVEGEFRDGVAWVDLAALSRGDDVTQAVADALGVSPGPGERLAARIVAALHARLVLIVLDNCEHVGPAASTLVQELLAVPDKLRVLATSRERLGGQDGVVVSLSSLPHDASDSPAVRLLAHRIGSDGPTPPPDRLRDLAARLDGVPLALELAAARCHTLGLDAVLERVGESFDLLRDDKGTVPRHRSLAAALQWSFDLLTASEQQLMVALSLFATDFDLAAAERLATASGVDAQSADALVSSLVDKSLISRSASGFRILMPTREFAREVGKGDPRWSDFEAAHTEYVIERSNEIHEGLRGRDELRWIDELAAFWPEVRAAIRRAFDQDDVGTIAVLVPMFSYVDAFWRRPELFSWAAEAVGRYRDVPVAGRHNLLAAGCTAAWLGLDIPLAVDLADEALAADPRPGLDDDLPRLAAIGAYTYAGRFADAMAVVRAGTEQAAENGDLYQEAWLLGTIGMVLGVAGTDPVEAKASATRAVRIARTIGSKTILAYTLITLGVAAISDPELAAAAAAEARAAALESSNQWALLMGTALESDAHSRSGTQDELATQLAMVGEFYRAGWTAHAWTILGSTVRVLFELDRKESAAVVAGACEASDLAKLKHAELPAAAQEALLHDPALIESRRLGACLSLPDVLRTLTEH